ncbi:MAG: aminoglycoside phosphotransferase family protein [Massiliimalia sp.]|jgi:aminoglycoside 2''-phosphotransferase
MEYPEIQKRLEPYGVPIHTLTFLGEGHDSQAFLLNGDQVVKIPRHEGARQRQKQEFALYHLLKDQNLSVSIPKGIWENGDFFVFSYVPGTQITYWQYHQLSSEKQEQLAKEEAEFLRRLHRVSIHPENPVLKDRIQDKRKRFETDRYELTLWLEEQGEMTASLSCKIQRFYDFLFSQKNLFEYTPVLVHNDFSASNMKFQNHHLTGVIDFADFLWGDPDQDFLYLLDNSTDDFGTGFGEMVLYYYGHDHPAAVCEKARINDLYWSVEQVLIGKQLGDFQMIKQGIKDLKELPF